MKKIIISISIIGSLVAGGASAAPIFPNIPPIIPTNLVCCKKYTLTKQANGMWVYFGFPSYRLTSKITCPIYDKVDPIVPTLRDGQNIVAWAFCRAPIGSTRLGSNVLENFKQWLFGSR